MIYIVEDDENIRELESYALKSNGFEVREFEDGDAFLKACKTDIPRLVILDIMLPKRDGLSALKDIRSMPETKLVPVILITAKGTELDKVKGLDLGADDYLTKPFSVLEMVSRVKALLRRANASAGDKETDVYTFGGITVDDRTHQVTADEKEILLTYKEYELLKFLIVNHDLVFTRDKLLENVWGYDFAGGSRTVDMHIKSLRQKLGDKGVYIKTIRNVGYRLGG